MVFYHDDNLEEFTTGEQWFDLALGTIYRASCDYEDCEISEESRVDVLFNIQQGVEKALKGLIVDVTGRELLRRDRVHDIPYLIDKLDALGYDVDTIPYDIRNNAELLSYWEGDARYYAVSEWNPGLVASLIDDADNWIRTLYEY